MPVHGVDLGHGVRWRGIHEWLRGLRDKPNDAAKCRAAQETQSASAALTSNSSSLVTRYPTKLIGSCAGGGGIWFDMYPVLGPVEKLIPVNYYIPGCPPRPEAIIYGVAVALGLVDKKTAPVEFKQLEYPIPRYHPEDLNREGDQILYEKLDQV